MRCLSDIWAEGSGLERSMWGTIRGAGLPQKGGCRGRGAGGWHEARGTAGNEEEPAGRRQVLADEER